MDPMTPRRRPGMMRRMMTTVRNRAVNGVVCSLGVFVVGPNPEPIEPEDLTSWKLLIESVLGA